MNLLPSWLTPGRSGRRRRQRPPDPSLRRSLVRYEVSPQVQIERYWKSLPIGKGPACSVWVRGEVVLRFDCFGKGQGHYHVLVGGKGRAAQARFYFSEESASLQIERMIFELKTNLHSYLQKHPVRRFRRTRVDPSRMDAVCDELRKGMLGYLDEVPELQCLAPPDS